MMSAASVLGADVCIRGVSFRQMGRRRESTGEGNKKNKEEKERVERESRG